MKIECTMIGICDYVLFSEENKASFQGLFDVVRGEGISRFFFFAKVEFPKGGEVKLNLKVTGECLIKKYEGETSILVNNISKAGYVVSEFVGMGFKKSGVVDFSLYYEGKKIKDTQLKVQFLKRGESLKLN